MSVGEWVVVSVALLSVIALVLVIPYCLVQELDEMRAKHEERMRRSNERIKRIQDNIKSLKGE